MKPTGCKDDCPVRFHAGSFGYVFVECWRCNRSGPVAVHGGTRTEEETHEQANQYWTEVIFQETVHV